MSITSIGTIGSRSFSGSGALDGEVEIDNAATDAVRLRFTIKGDWQRHGHEQIKRPSRRTQHGDDYRRTFLVDLHQFAVVYSLQWAAEARKQFNPIRELAEAMEGLDFPDGYCQAAFLDAAKLKISGDIPGELIARITSHGRGRGLSTLGAHADASPRNDSR